MHLIFYTWCCCTTEECIEARRDVLGPCSSLDLWLSCLISHPLKGYHSLYEHTETQSLFLWQQRTEISCRHCRGELSLFLITPVSCKIKIKPYCSAVAAPPLKACPASRQRTPWGQPPPLSTPSHHTVHSPHSVSTPSPRLASDHCPSSGGWKRGFVGFQKRLPGPSPEKNKGSVWPHL